MRAATGVLMFHTHRLARAGRQARGDTHTGLDAGLLVLAQRLALPATRLQVQHASGFGLQVGIIATLGLCKGKPTVAGNSQASALTSTMSSGGKARGRPGRALSSRPANRSLEEALAPLADHLSARTKPRCDLMVGDSGGRHEDHLGPLHFKIRQCAFHGSVLQLALFLV
jgi:hypothetical protein